MSVELRKDRLQERRQQIVNAAGEPLVLQAEQAIQQALTQTKIYRTHLRSFRRSSKIGES